MGIRFLSIWNAFAFLVTLLFWAAVALSGRVPGPWAVDGVLARGASATTWGFLLADILYSLPLLLLAAVGLRRRTAWGWLCAQIANALWIYSMSVLYFRDGFTRLSPGSVVFLPFLVVAVVALPFLWKTRSRFGIG